MGKTLFITDLDGTLLNKDAKITPVTAEIINNLIDEGMIFTYASARGYAMASKFAGEINFKYPAVQHNGGCIQNPQTGEYFHKCIFGKNIVSEIIRKFQSNNIFPLVYAFIDGEERYSWISGEKTGGETKIFLESRKNDKRKRPVENYGDFLEGDIHAFLLVNKSPEELRGILDILNLNEYFTHHIQKDTYSELYFLDIIRFDAGKDSAVYKVKELTGADKIVCFGDNINDIPMFNVSDEKYAVANAIDEVKKIATDIIGSNNDDGVAMWLQKNARNYF